MNAEMEMNKTILKQANEMYAEAFALCKKAKAELAKIGVKVINATSGTCGSRDEVLLMSGINIISQTAETPVMTSAGSNFGTVWMDGFGFTQCKLPVERTDRYA